MNTARMTDLLLLAHVVVRKSRRHLIGRLRHKVDNKMRQTPELKV